MLSSSPLMLFSLRVWCWYNGYSGTVGTEEEWDLWARWQGEILPAVAVKQSLMWTYPAERASWPERQPGWRLLSDLCHFKAGVLSFSVLHPFIPLLLHHSPHLLACSLPLCLSSSQPRFPHSGDNDIRTDGRFWDLFVRRSHNALCLALLFFSWFTHTLKTFSSSLGRIISWHLFCCSQYYWNSYEMLSHTYLAVFKTTYQITKCGSNKTQTVMWN